MRKTLGVMLLLIGMAGTVMAQLPPGGGPVPEIDPSSAGTALTLLAGGLLVIRGFRKK